MFVRVLLLGFFGASGVFNVYSVRAAEEPAVVTKVSGRDASGEPLAYLAQPAVSQRLSLDANNGFFDHGAFTATGKRTVPSWDSKYISAHFSALASTPRMPGSTGPKGDARWYVWLPATGTLRIRIDPGDTGRRSQVASDDRWKLSIADQSRIVSVPRALGTAGTSNTESGKGVQPSELEFRITRIGAHCLTLTDISKSSDQDPRSTIRRVVLSGVPAETGEVLRARWRPAAIHTSYHCSDCPTTKMWVFETESVASQSSYSPMTTAFGYFGASFDGFGRAAGGVNFSMWAASSKSTTLPPLTLMPRLLATGNPNADFSGFGHEGSGVKIRNWEPYAHHPKSVIQALRVETDRDPETGLSTDTYYGYLFDEATNHWTLYAVGRRPQKLRRGADPGSETKLRVASFCEVPGPPDRQRTGDQVRTIRRRGWFWGETGKWHRVDCQTLGGLKSPWTSRSIGSTADGWLTMSTGGIEMRRPKTRVCLSRQSASEELPLYLQPDRVAGLSVLPVRFSSHGAKAISSTAATVSYEFVDAGSNATATLHYGRADCLTFAPRTLHGTERKGLSRELFSEQRSWESQSKNQHVDARQIEFQLHDLEPGTEYFYRVLITNEQGKSWDFESGNFSTQ